MISLPLLAEALFGGVPTYQDMDGDGLPNDWEAANHLDGLDPSDASSDFDLDGLTALQEYQLWLT